MNQHRRLKTIELSMTPRQIVLLWLETAQKAGSYIDAARQSLFPRRVIATRVSNAIRASLKGQPELVIQGAITQAQQEADLLYLLIVKVNSTVDESVGGLRMCCAVLDAQYEAVAIAYGQDLHAVSLIEGLRRSILLFVEKLLILEETCRRITSIHLSGQDVLFPEIRAELREWIQAFEIVAHSCNAMAENAGTKGIDLDEIRASIQSEADKELVIWLDQAELAMLVTCGGMAWRKPADRLFSIDGESNTKEESTTGPAQHGDGG